MARQTAPIAPEELSTWLMAGEIFSNSSTAPSAASVGSLRAACFSSASASLMRMIGVSDFQPKALRRKRTANCHCGVGMGLNSNDNMNRNNTIVIDRPQSLTQRRSRHKALE
jgi:hypothetical protein